jgi:anti-sigma regulatory factor (Ser/Thr protein kinase)
MTSRNHLDSEVAVMALSADPVSIPHARHFVGELTRHLGDPELCSTLELLVSELVTNAILHSPAPRNLRVILEENRVRVEVEDRGERPPRLADGIDLLVSSGRGLQIVDRLSNSWGYDPLDAGGKVVWFELKRG